MTRVKDKDGFGHHTLTPYHDQLVLLREKDMIDQKCQLQIPRVLPLLQSDVLN